MNASICVVGAGPRGTSVLERITANAPSLAPDRRLDVHLVDPYPPGGGHVWQADQPGDLLMNTVAADATLFTDTSVRCAGPVLPGPSLHEWARTVARDDPDPGVRAEAARMRPWSHPSRRFHGRYLAWAFARAVSRAPASIRVHRHRTRAVAITSLAGGRQRVALEDGSGPLDVDSVVLTLGHTDVEPDPAQRALAGFAEEHGLFYGPPANPLDLDPAAVPPGTPLLVRGLGMNFFDHMSLFTVGRGGRFAREGSRLRYRPSGDEPLMYAGSRRGVPYQARGDYGAMPPTFPARYFDDAAVARLRAAGPVDFREAVWPLIAKETAYVYYDTLTRVRPGACALDPAEVRAGFDALSWTDPALARLVERAFPDPSVRLDFAALDRPLSGATFSGDSPHRGVVTRLRADLAEARDAGRSPLKTAMTALGATRGRVRRLVAYGGLTGDSHRRDLDGWFRGFAASVSSGPPAGRIEELLALADAGLIRFVGPGMTVTADPRRKTFLATSPQAGGEPVAAPAFLEAHLPGPDLRHTGDPLLRQLRETGACRPYRIPTPGGAAYETGGLEVTESPFHLVAADGRPHPRRFALGIPIESVHWGTAIGAVPRSNAAMLLQTDAVARAAILAGDTAPAPRTAGHHAAS
ncbi:FAD/NAD(P)-binding protein [Actinomadura sp. DC4]|uniref:FAD/NAD(P)-binding protein n=1 Tax=Actinomadura sp. DC4 TaxID=3055069 RepID=UPI0025B02854|nr:FAD/NAD(P)-binding protein [Actinomadura sp. DC4]MDN3353604.1 FAD/NAD(P)-binding protein [Actinomadura sp. DC4]